MVTRKIEENSCGGSPVSGFGWISSHLFRCCLYATSYVLYMCQRLCLPLVDVVCCCLLWCALLVYPSAFNFPLHGICFSPSNHVGISSCMDFSKVDSYQQRSVNVAPPYDDGPGSGVGFPRSAYVPSLFEFLYLPFARKPCQKHPWNLGTALAIDILPVSL